MHLFSSCICKKFGGALINFQSEKEAKIVYLEDLFKISCYLKRLISYQFCLEASERAQMQKCKIKNWKRLLY